MFDPKAAELHLGILQNRLGYIRDKQQACDQKIMLKEGQEGKDLYPSIDLETEKLTKKALQREYDKLDKKLTEYEDGVLKLTPLENA